MPISPSLVNHVENLLNDVLRFSAPADRVISDYFRSHRQLGQHDRSVIAEAVFAVLRRKLEFAQFAQSGQGRFTQRLAQLGLAFTAGVDELTSVLGVHATDWLRAILLIEHSSLAFATRCNLPEWLLPALRERYRDEEIESLVAALNRPAPLDLRVNSLKATRAQALEDLNAAGIAARETPYAPLGIRLQGKPALQQLHLFTQGAVEVQDEGSQLLAHVLAPKRGELVIDFCAGAGGKTLALGALMRSTGRLYAYDISAKRLAKLKPRMARSGLSNIHPVLIDSERDPKLKRMAGKADRVLVDAPCSGLGTLRRNPDLKWRQTPAAITEMNHKQAQILAAAARLVKPGGRLVYATCSFLDSENQAIVGAFLNSHPEFKRLDVQEILHGQQIEIDTGAYLELSPAQHGTDGFFAAALQRH